MSDRELDVLVVVGTRPEAIKMAPVVGALRDEDGLRPRLVLTGQHTDLVDQVLDAFDLEPSFDLEIMREGQSLYGVAERCLRSVRDVVRRVEPRLILAQGDTATVFFSSLVSFFEKTAVGHVEAGLRSGDKWSPFPEEMFRRLTDDLADVHFAPTPASRDHLREEGVDPGTVHVTGNTVVDALRTLAPPGGPPDEPDLRDALDGAERLVLLTAHRRESFGAPMRELFRAVRALADRHDGVSFLYPVHPNPRVQKPAREILSDHPGVRLTAPLGYLDLLRALRAATLVLTDSGGIQEEAPSFGTPVLVLRENTERPEGVRAGSARLVGTDGDEIVTAASELLTNEGARQKMARTRNPYGDGYAADRIADIAAAELLGRPRRTEDWAGVD